MYQTEYYITDYAIRDLQGTATWGKFLSLVGFIFTAAYLILCLGMGPKLVTIHFMPSIWPTFPLALKIFCFMLPGILYFVPNFLFYQISQRTLNILNAEVKEILAYDIKYYRKTIDQIGIMMIIALVFFSVAIMELILNFAAN